MSNRKDKLIREDLLEAQDLLWSQLKEDREFIKDMFTNISNTVKGNPTQMAVNGDILAKFGDLLIKNTSQVLELTKTLSKEKENDDSLSPEDWDNISKAIKTDE